MADFAQRGHAPGPVRERNRHHGACPWVVVRPARGDLFCQHCDKTELLPPRERPELAAAAIEGFVTRHANCAGPLRAVTVRRGRFRLTDDERTS
jgi:hypothetical protein